jgi:hypothetical protein
MNHSTILSRAFEITRRYKVLWLFGFLVALASGGNGGGINYAFSGSGSGGGSAGAGRGASSGWEDLLNNPQLPPGIRRFLETLQQEVIRYRWEEIAPTLIGGVAVLLCCLALVFLVVQVLRYVARVALIRGVDQIEATGGAPTWREGFRMGWSHRTFRLFVLEVIVFGVAAFCIGALMAIAIVPMVIGIAGVSQGASSNAIAVPAILLGFGMLACLIPFGIVIGIALSVLGELWAREIVLADRGIGDALADGYHRARRRLADVGLLWLILLLAGMVFGVIMILVAILILLVAGSIAVGIGYIVFAVSASALWSLAIGGAALMLGMMIPMTLIAGLWEVFRSSVWTLAWRELAAPSPLPMPDPAA